MSLDSPLTRAASAVPAPRREPTTCRPGAPGVPLGAPVDEGWAAGFEMGRLDAQLAARPVRSRVGLSIRARNRDAAEALASRHRYELTVREGAEVGSLWAEFRPAG